jgi:Tfp pilus assembly protein PilX
MGRFSVINVIKYRHSTYPDIYIYYVKDNNGTNDFLITASSSGGYAMQPVSRTTLEK